MALTTAVVEAHLCAISFQGHEKQQHTNSKAQWDSKSQSGWTLLLSGPDILCSSKEDRSVWPIRMAVPSGDDIQAEAQAVLKGHAHKSGDSVLSGNSCPVSASLIGTSKSMPRAVI